MNFKSRVTQSLHHTVCTFLMILVLVIGSSTFRVYSHYYDLSDLKVERQVQSEIAQIVQDEGYRAKPYRDSLGQWTVGFGHLIKDGETFDELTPHKAVEMLRHDYANASEDVERHYNWATGDVRLVLINMSYQLGSTRLSKFTKTLAHLKAAQYDLAAGEMLTSLWAEQTPNRASRLAGRIMALTQ